MEGWRLKQVMRLGGGLSRVAHRGATGSDRTGDGAGILTRIPEPIFRRDAARRGIPLAEGAPVGVGTFFFPRGAEVRAAAIVEKTFADEGLPLAGWRDVPVNVEGLGKTAASEAVYRRVPGLLEFGTTAQEGFRGGILVGSLAYSA